MSSVTAKELGRARAHLGDKGELLFAAQLPEGWVWQPPRRDFGKDGIVVVRDGSDLHNLEFSLQIKTSVQPKFRDGHVVIGGISRAAVRYWFASPLPTLVVALDLRRGLGWYAWHLDLFDSPAEVFGGKSKTVTVHIPQKNKIDSDGWVDIRAEINRHYRSLQRAITADAGQPYLLGIVSQISRIAGNLIRLASVQPPRGEMTETEGRSLLIEQKQLWDLIELVRSLLGRVDADSEGHKQIRFWLSSFEATALKAHPSLRSFPEGESIPLDFELVVDVGALTETRPALVLAAVDLIRMLSGGPEPPTGVSSTSKD